MTDGGLRPLELGELLDAAFKIYRARWRDLMKVAAVFTIPSAILQTLIRMSTSSSSVPFFGGSSFTGPAAPGRTTVASHQVAVQLGGTIGLAVVSVIATSLALGGILRIVAGVYLGDEVSWRESARFALRRFGSLLWVTVILIVVQIVGLFLCCIGYLWAWPTFFASVPALMVEDRRGTKALKRSMDLVQGRFWWTLLTLVLGALVAGVLSGALSVVLVVAIVASSGNLVVLAVVTGITSFISTTVVTPFTASLSMAMYFDLRVRKEGFDLWLLAQGVGVAPGSGDFPAQPGAPTHPAAGWAPPPPGAWGAAPPPGWGAPPAGWGAPPNGGGPQPSGWPQQAPWGLPPLPPPVPPPTPPPVAPPDAPPGTADETPGGSP